MRVFYICFALLHVIWRRQFYFLYVWFSIQELSYIKVMWFTFTSWVSPKLPDTHLKAHVNFCSLPHQTNVPCFYVCKPITCFVANQAIIILCLHCKCHTLVF